MPARRKARRKGGRRYKARTKRRVHYRGIKRRAPYVRRPRSVYRPSVVRKKGPRMAKLPVGDCIMSHAEFITDIYSSTSFSTFQLNINAALGQTFPWLSAVASNFEQYRFVKLYFIYRAASGASVASTSTALGTILMTHQYSALNANFVNKQQQEAYYGTRTNPPFQSFKMAVDCRRQNNPTALLYTRTSGVPSGADQRLYDMGTINVSTVGFQHAGDIAGELLVAYTVRLSKPKLQGGKGSNSLVLGDHFQLTAANLSTSAYFGTGLVNAVSGSNIGGTLSSDGKDVGAQSGNLNYYSFPIGVRSGSYWWMYQVTGASSTLTNAIAASYGSNLTGFSIIGGDATGSIGVSAGSATSASQIFFGCAYFNGANTQNQSFIHITAGTLPGTITSGDLFVGQLNPYILTMLSHTDMAEIEKFKLFAKLMGMNVNEDAEKRMMKSILQQAPRQKPTILGGSVMEGDLKARTYSLQDVCDNVNRIDTTLGLPLVPGSEDPPNDSDGELVTPHHQAQLAAFKQKLIAAEKKEQKK